LKELFNEAKVRTALSKLVPKGSVAEIRALDAELKGQRYQGTFSGYFDNPDSCVNALGTLANAVGTYITLNPVNPALLARCANRLAYVGKKPLTTDQHILKLEWVLIDVDCDRPSGISATAKEKKAAHRKTLQILKFLEERGWRGALIADSGNGFHLLFRIDLPCSDEGLIKKVLAALADHFDDDKVKLDRTVFNPARIVRLYGTLAAKGDDTDERPHRITKIVKAALPTLVEKEQLEALVEELQPEGAPDPGNRRSADDVDLRQGAFDVNEFLSLYNVAVKTKTVEPNGTTKWTLEECPFNADHKSPDAAVLQFPGGRLGFKCFHSSCANNHWKEFRQHFEPDAWRSPRDSNEWATDLSQFTPLDEARFPAPLGEDAYYGLAGNIVRQIFPETEADPAALLFTFLAGFGNMIGRNPYMTVGATRHYLNLYVVTVGRTSVSRKGTAWMDTRRVLKSIDEDWTRKNVEGGLSSGEGVIHRIRDEINEEKPVKEKGRYTGQYDTVKVDPGIEDKSLFILETEFCSPLKVMAREGNTLSPVLRAAWDGHDLGTLTKNSRERATKPYVSLVGHITREELRKNFTEIEMANGFGNRISWIATTRSKVLPSGGCPPDIAGFFDSLSEAVLFAQTCGELKRDDEAEKLWAQVYPELSSNKSGLLGAIVVRGAPQVLRIGAIYAVLDCSPLVMVPHLKAALECWRYAEASARWIFETGTGDKAADRILTALIAAGFKGLTKTQIVYDVFNRHISKFTTDEALRLLHHLGLAFCLMEDTKGRPTEHWFFKGIGDKSDKSDVRGDN